VAASAAITAVMAIVATAMGTMGTMATGTASRISAPMHMQTGHLSVLHSGAPKELSLD
jgi:hypothetical protein